MAHVVAVRTGTLCSLLLSALYGLDRPMAPIYFQALHDMRAEPRLVVAGYLGPSDCAGAWLSPQSQPVHEGPSRHRALWPISLA